ncbi:bifunctional biotin--[acetyl-CoA-carboxylase] ligase/biotin operon repressor BirA [Oceanicoccus sp. KOV_DT_Chl]|uniref:bifunctional biotin--[acetyl-CoA-carboxylase] ligase/biotin operon repressor BirA n=1 Tax=Oceanicoccus sp. KOV_DT_Chl TaxID=1904639 RepID=UPI000C79A6C3|nr:bifunctional biotin--[acetyl-CoA-carboxylase] ligase/biotin operon repressor BirA [Oceanicoccus sp. KOV_DT_Chl]
MSLETLLKVLSDGLFHSGDDLGRVLGVSRTAVWKQLKKIEELNLPLESIKGKGYCVPGGLDLLSEEKIRRNLSVEASGLVGEVDVCGVIDSTNNRAMAKAAGGARGYVCLAEQQTAGKGRRGRPWQSPYAGNIYLSVAWEFASGAMSLEGLSLAVGVAVVDALAKNGVEGARLKWPNDVLHNGNKLAGILLEMSGDPSGPCQVVVGVGVNVRMPGSMVIDQPWTDVQSIKSSAADRNKLLSAILNELMPVLAGFEQHRFALYRDRWQLLDAFKGKKVAMILGQERVLGHAIGVDEAGAMMLETAGGVRTFNGGEVSLRLHEGEEK